MRVVVWKVGEHGSATEGVTAQEPPESKERSDAPPESQPLVRSQVAANAVARVNRRQAAGCV